MRWSIRWRLTLLNTLAVGVLLGTFAALVYWLFDRALVGSVDTRLLECRRQLEHDPAVAADPARLRYLIEEFWEHEHDVLSCVLSFPPQHPLGPRPEPHIRRELQARFGTIQGRYSHAG